METVTLKPLFHRAKECIGIYCPQNGLLNRCLQQNAGARWSNTNKCWYVPCNQDNYKKLLAALKEHANVTVTALKQYLEDKKKTKTGLAVAIKQEFIEKNEAMAQPVVYVRAVQKNTQRKLSNENLETLHLFRQKLVLRSYSSSTIKTYTNEFAQFLYTIKNKPAKEFTIQRVKDYLEYCHTSLKLSENTLYSRINSLKFYYEQVLDHEKFFWEVPRPKRPIILPRLLNEDELRKLFNALINKKHKAMLFTAYSAGLRVSEIANLKIADIDSKRMQIFVERAKGKKDRYVNLSPLLLDILRKYLKEYKRRPNRFLFESETTGTAYPTRTIQQVFSNAKHKAGISKEVGVHSLRNSFATHLLDKGTDIKYIKDLLGHFNIKTTERYLQVSKKQLVNIVSPFDDLYKNEEIEW